MASADSLKKTLSSLKGHRSRYQKRFDENLKYSDIKRTEQLKTLLLEQNDKVIVHLEKMLDAVEDEQVQAFVGTQMDEADSMDKEINEMFVVYCQRINESVAQIDPTNEEDGHEIATHVRPNAHPKNIHKKPPEMDGDISLKDFEIWKRKFLDYLVISLDHLVQSYHLMHL